MVSNKSALFVFLVVFAVQLTNVASAGAGQNTSGWAWSDNIGWISFNNGSYGVNVDVSNGKFSGYAWSDNIGWISFNESDTGAPPSDDPCSDASCIAKVTPLGQLGKGDVAIKGWARALSYGGGWDGWIRFDHGAGSAAYLDADGNWQGWAWGSDVVGWISFNGSGYKVSTLGVFNNPPSASIPSSPPDPGSHEIVNYCGNSPSNINLAWVFSDPDTGDSQSAYQLSVTRLSDSANCDTGKQTSSISSLFVMNLNAICGSVFVGYDSSGLGYDWKVKVWDSKDKASGWSNTGHFSTPKHQYPSCTFSYAPPNPTQGETVQFNSDNSQCFDADSVCDTYSWDFENDGVIDSTLPNPLHTFASKGAYTTVLKVSDSDNYVCSHSESIGVKFKLPSWKEILPW